MAFQRSESGMKLLCAAIAALVLGGCATFSQDGGIDTVVNLTRERTGQTVQPARTDSERAGNAKTVEALLAQPLSADGAVQIALLNNQGLRASLSELGIAEADLVQAGRMRNPSFSFGRMRGGENVEIERGIMFDLLGLLTMPIRSNIEQRRFEQEKLQVALQAVVLAGAARKAYFNAIAAQQAAHFMAQVGKAAEASAELGRRMARVGNWSKLDAAREQAFHADAVAQMARVQHNALAAREELARMLGLWGTQTVYQLPERLPDLPKSPNAIDDIETQAMQQRLDIQMARRDAETTASALGLTRATGFINVLHAGYANKSETGAVRANGYEVELELPIFDWSGSKIAKAESIYMQSVHRTADIAVLARSQVREAYSAYRTTYDIARHYRDEIVPLRKKISDEMLLRYNGMYIGVFELLADARDQINSVNAAIEAQRDYWNAETDLQLAINGSGGTIAQLRGRSAPQPAQH